MDNQVQIKLVEFLPEPEIIPFFSLKTKRIYLLTCIQLTTPVLSIRDATFTVLPQISY
jgi:hypothetical protein